MSDIIDRAESSLKVAYSREGMGMVFASVVEDLVQELKDTRAEVHRLAIEASPTICHYPTCKVDW